MGRIWRVILDGNLSGYYNMACDEALLNLYSQKRIPILRIYGWSQPSVSLGYFQRVEEVLNLREIEKENISIVRRITGGGAILHHQEITYSLILSREDLSLPFSVKQSYSILTSFIVEFYRSIGLKPSFAYQVSSPTKKFDNFCFSSWEYFDIVIKGKKIGGNAQKRRKNLIFQHGSIPLKVNFPLIKRLFKNIPQDIQEKTQGLSYFLHHLNIFELREKLISSFKNTFKITLYRDKLSTQEEEEVEALLNLKYTCESWNFNRNEKTSLVK
ncbi:MAG: lipoate--protein ligase family protein [Candidatus Omnitrophota bacterium]|nr:MAG: lipoate--protein ligase family protein [Candidatus Omnitrophota bacterium]